MRSANIRDREWYFEESVPRLETGGARQRALVERGRCARLAYRVEPFWYRGAGLVYLVTAWKYEDGRHYVLHRMSEPALLETPSVSPAEFSLAAHTREELRFSYPAAKVELRALFDQDAAEHLTESRLAPDQRATEHSDGLILIEPQLPIPPTCGGGFWASVEQWKCWGRGHSAKFRDHARQMNAAYRRRRAADSSSNKI